MTRPLQSRANNDLINGALQQLQAAQVTQFVTDDTNADLTAFGLQPAGLDLWLGHGTNFTLGIHVGKSLTNGTTQVYAKREGWNAIVTTSSEPFAPWHGAVNDFRDPFLLELHRPRPSPKSRCATTAATISRCSGRARTAGGSPAKNFRRTPPTSSNS